MAKGDDIKQKPISVSAAAMKGGGWGTSTYKLGTAGGYPASGDVEGCSKPNYCPPDRGTDTSKKWSPKDPSA